MQCGDSQLLTADSLIELTSPESESDLGLADFLSDSTGVGFVYFVLFVSCMLSCSIFINCEAFLILLYLYFCLLLLFSISEPSESSTSCTVADPPFSIFSL